MYHMRTYFYILIVSLFILSVGHVEAAFQATSKDEILIGKYNAIPTGGEKLKVLVVPGHDSQFSGALFAKTREVTFNRILAEKLYGYLKADIHFNPVISQVNGEYIPELKNYFDTHVADIAKFRADKVKAMGTARHTGVVETNDVTLAHAAATSTVVTRLYGTNKWSNENGIDMLLHVHFNDYGSHTFGGPGQYTGFSIYTPERQFGNALPAIGMGNEIYKELARAIFPSDYPGENLATGALEDQDLIATGANNSLNAPSVLTEYSYIYEPLVQSDFFPQVADVLAYKTYLGVHNFFTRNTEPLSPFPKYMWTTDKGKDKDITKAKASFDTAMLQMVLRNEGLYPPKVNGIVKSQEECPITGKFGSCTELALKAYQQKYAITPATGYLGPKTRGFLNIVYGK